jgi:hypothetical protein
MAEFWGDLVVSAMRDLGMNLAAVLPRVLALLTLLGLGLALGRVVGALVARVARALRLDERGRNWELTAALSRAGIARSPSQVLRLIAFWGIFVSFATMGIDAMALPGLPGATGLVMGLFTRALTALVIAVAGILIANFLGQAVLVAAVNAGLPEARLLARATRWGVLLFTVATALTEVGIGRDMVLIAFGITFGGLVLALALAFGIGGRRLARRILERRFRPGDEAPPQETPSHL